MKATQLLVMDMEVAGMKFFLPSNYHCQFPSGDFSCINDKINKFQNIWSYVFNRSCTGSLYIGFIDEAG